MAWSGCAVLALTLAGCSGENGARTEAWAEDVCDGMQPEVQKIQAANAAIAEASEGEDEPAEVQEVYSSAYQDLSDAFAGLATAVDEAGDPPVEDGEQLREDAVAELNGTSEAYAGIKEASDGLDTSDRGEFADGLRDMVGRLEELSQTGDEALSRLQSGELGSAMAEQEGCQGAPVVPGDGNGEGDGDDAGNEDAGNEDGEDAGGEDAEDRTDDAGADTSRDDAAEDDDEGSGRAG
ncbi:small secreted protein [Streptomyces sp. ACA25]|uniref:small secreted protein n=1 Tax=Streptomyces sp. ACA25 TaxID=3022596 RepID=UPI002306DF4B|nr:small secreted protein [Streptomyces sp. ACA25]MDB1086532.1 small secreted protein [Streptomyces sp. ACA25]